MIKATTTNTAATTTRLIRAMDRQHPVTITYTDRDGAVTVRTIEIYDFEISQAGDIRALAMDRGTGEKRGFRIDRISATTVHRTRYLVAREDSTPARPTLRHPGDAAAILCPTAALLAAPGALLTSLLSH
ncbi:WYL domain-containing protein (plasmid) [Kitasatospora sp. NBC_01246]|uniref:WYL domain-containing protein n=1 Tax=Kitasatospora sp. NBC_01246 TaxID=2903570 RepID=UPI002E33E999|nr:WYL domain-containing protein [Kitasatospora sp. NBC_01246]